MPLVGELGLGLLLSEGCGVEGAGEEDSAAVPALDVELPPNAVVDAATATSIVVVVLLNEK